MDLLLVDTMMPSCSMRAIFYQHSGENSHRQTYLLYMVTQPIPFISIFWALIEVQG